MDLFHWILATMSGSLLLVCAYMKVKLFAAKDLGGLYKAHNDSMRDDLTAWRAKSQQLEQRVKTLDSQLAGIREAANK